MEGTESTTTQRATGNDGNKAAVNMELLSGKPLHRFVQRQPKILGIVILIFGCAELMMGFTMSRLNIMTSWHIYIPLWQGVLFFVCGNLSIYTEIHPSKRTVTASLAMYVVTLLGILVSFGYRIYVMLVVSLAYPYRRYMPTRTNLLFSLEFILFTSSLCVLVLLIFLSCVARIALKSSRTQVVFQQVLPPQTDMTTN